MAYKTITIYGADTEDVIAGQEFPDKTDVEALSGVVSQNFDTVTVNGGFVAESENFEYLDGQTLQVDSIRNTFTPEGKYIRNDETTDLDTLFNPELFSKRYKWVYVGDYQPRPSGLTTLKCMAVNVNFDLVNGTDYKGINFDLTSRYEY